MKKAILLFTILFLCLGTFSVSGQKYDYTWLIGHAVDTFAYVNYINFNSPFVTVSFDTTVQIDLEQTNICMSDENGNLLFYSNGWQIFNAAHQPLDNSEDFNDSPFNWQYIIENSGMDMSQLLLVLPPLNNESKIYHLFHIKPDYFSLQDTGYYLENVICGFRLHYSSINMEANGGLGTMETKGMFLLQDTLAPGRMVATKHANGRDWWIIIPKQNSNLFHRILLTPEGPQVLQPQAIGDINIFPNKLLGQAAFSPNGNWYAIDKIETPQKELFFLKIFSFDRCSGLLSSPTSIMYAPTRHFGGGVAFSPDSRYLYQANSSDILQYDLESTNIKASQKVAAVYDAYTDMYLAYFFYNAQLGPNGKIYINVSNGNRALHEISKPNLPGALSDLRQRKIQLSYHSNFSIPTYPNYRLGPLEGSPCDTLGLENIPLAGFTYEMDSVNTKFISFFDNSFYEAQNWYWDFGDGTSATRPNPLHEYQQGGTYSVCLTVSNDYGENTLCQFVQIP